MQSKTILTGVLVVFSVLIVGVLFLLIPITNTVDVFPRPEGIVVENDAAVVMRDGVTLSTNVYRPEKAGVFR